MELKVIKTDEEYQAALRQVERLFELDDSLADRESIKSLLDLIEAYEDKN